MALSATKKAKLKAAKVYQARLGLLDGKTTYMETNWDRAISDFLRDGTFDTDLPPGPQMKIAYAYLTAMETGTNPAEIVLGAHIEITRRGDDTAHITFGGKDAL